MASAADDERLAVALEVAAGEVELVSDELFALGATAVSEIPAQDAITLVADLTPEAASALGERRNVRVLEPEPVWDHGWREHARAWRCGSRLVVRPPWVPAPGDPGPDDVEVVVDPGGAFGSGSHPTTRRCLAALEANLEPGASVLDVGCGSGVLGVAAALLGAREVRAVDVDPEAVRATGETAAANGVADVVAAATTPLAEVRGSYDLVVANLLIPVIEEVGPELVGHLAPGGTLVVGGVLTGQRDRALRALEGTRVHSEVVEDGWLTLVLRAPPVG